MADLIGHRTLVDLLEERVERTPEKTWLVFEDAAGTITDLTYAQFLEATQRLAAGLREEARIGRGDKVAVVLGNCPELVLLFFAVARLGAVLVPCNPRHHPAELAYAIGFGDAKALVAPAARAREVLPCTPAVERLVTVGEPAPDAVAFDALLAHEPFEDRALVRPEDPIQILFTSGTTAHPKGVLVTHANELFAGEQVARSYLLDGDDRSLTALPLFHLNAQAISMLSMLTVGGTLIAVEEYRATKFWDQLRAHHATHTSLVGMLVRTLLAQPPAPTDADHDVRRVSFALNVTDEEREAFERRFGVELINGYGLSEAVAGVTVAPVDGPRRWPSIGLPAVEREVRIVDEDGRDVPTGAVGEVLVRGVPGRTLMLGYYKDPKATAAAIDDGWLRTGDHAYADDADYLYFFDRKKDIVKRAGENISASEVERLLAEHPLVTSAAVIGVPDPIRDEAVKALVVADGALTEEELVDHCRARMAAYKVPTIVEFRATLPLTSVGKVDKKRLREEHAQQAVQV